MREPKNKDLIDYFKAKEIADTLADEVQRQCDASSDEPNDKIIELIQQEPIVTKTIRHLSNPDRLRNISREMDDINKEKKKRVNYLVRDINARKKRRTHFRIISSTIAAAVLFLSFLFYHSSQKNELKQYVAVTTIEKKNDTQPTLILSNGEKINLSSSDRLDINERIKNDQGRLIYQTKPDTTKSVEHKTTYNTLTTPKMATYKVVLPDKTEVTLNANSELKYPTEFTGDTREVYLKGEAYFDVAKVENQFIVHTSNVGIKVYGTKFNVSANNYRNVKTVLLSGSVGVEFLKNDGTTERMMMKPNEMVTVHLETEKLSIESVDAEIYTAWMDGCFSYYSNRLEEILEKLSMWYNIDFFFENSKNKDIIITCSFVKDAPMSEIIHSIEKITDLKFIKKGENQYLIK